MLNKRVSFVKKAGAIVLGRLNTTGAIASALFQAWSEETSQLVVLVVELNRNVVMAIWFF